MKTLRLLPQPIKGILLSHYNDCLALGIAPDHWKLSKVIMIYIYINQYKGNNKSSRYLPLSLSQIPSTKSMHQFNKALPTLLSSSYSADSLKSLNVIPHLSTESCSLTGPTHLTHLTLSDIHTLPPPSRGTGFLLFS